MCFAVWQIALHSWLYESPCTELAGERVYCWLEAFSCFLLKSSRTHCVPFACTAYMQRVLSCSFIGLNRRLYNAVSRFRIASVCTHWRVQFALAALLQPLALFLSLESVGVTESDADLVRWSGAATVTGPNFQNNFYVINCLLTSPFKSFLLMLGIFFGSFWILLVPFGSF